MRLPTWVGMLLLCHGAIACTEFPPSSAVSEEVSISAPAAPATGWADLLGPTSAPNHWQVEPCENPVLLCVTANGEILGTVERFSHPLSEVALPGRAPTTPETQRQFLEAWVADHYTAIRTDRAGGDPKLQFPATTPTPARVGSLPGLRYGYTITHPNGVVFDRAVGYVATDGDQVYVFFTGIISGDPSGSFGDEGDLATFEPHLATIMGGLRL
ncbi:MAG: hypothetical protein ACFCVD_16050 [Nodosilinea sp.]